MDLQGQTRCTMSVESLGGRAGKHSGPDGCRRKFLKYFHDGFHDEKYVDWEREYKRNAHLRWVELLSRPHMRSLMHAGNFMEIARRAVAIEARTNLLFSFEKMALRDAIRQPAGARAFAEGLFEFLHGRGSEETRFGRWVDAVASLPRRQTRVLTWPVVTVTGFIAQPDRHIFLKPNVTRRAAKMYGFDFQYRSQPNWNTYRCLLEFGEQVRKDQRALRPRDMIDIQSFLWVQGSDEYP